jgi:hypothetical protein
MRCEPKAIRVDHIGVIAESVPNCTLRSTATLTAWPLIMKVVMLIFLDAFPQEIYVACIDRCPHRLFAFAFAFAFAIP